MKNLLEKYFNGEASLEEEAQLRAYFNSEEVDESLKEYVPLFQFYTKQQQLEVSPDFDEKLFARIDAEANSIKSLVDKYFEGQTSLEEENQLKEYFNNHEVEPSLQPYQPLFQYFENETERTVSSDFDEQLFRKIEGGAKIVQMRAWRKRMVRVAAVAAIFLGAVLIFNKPWEVTKPNIDWTAYEISDEQLAYEETVKALKLLSSKLNKGKKRTIQEVSKSEPVTKYLN